VVKQARAEDDGTVLAIGHEQAIPSVLFQKCYDPFPVGVVVLDLPMSGRLRAADDQAAASGVQIGVRRRDPEIDTDGRIVGVDIDRRLRLQAFEGPGLGEGIRAENIGKRTPQLIGDLQDQRAGESVFEIGRDEAGDMGEVVPDRALQQEPATMSRAPAA
jgi:hypothetical protein